MGHLRKGYRAEFIYNSEQKADKCMVEVLEAEGFTIFNYKKQ